MYAALRIVVPTQRSLLPLRAELSRLGRLVGGRGLVLALEFLDGRERDDLGWVKAAAVPDLLTDLVRRVVEDRRGRDGRLVGIAPGVGLLPHVGDLATSQDAASARRRVEEQIERDVPLDMIEQFIDTLALPDEDKDSLWLLAWSELRMMPRKRRTVVTPMALAMHP